MCGQLCGTAQLIVFLQTTEILQVFQSESERVCVQGVCVLKSVCVYVQGVLRVCAMKENVWISAPSTERDLESGLSNGVRVWTRKMVNYAGEWHRDGCSQRQTSLNSG